MITGISIYTKHDITKLADLSSYGYFHKHDRWSNYDELISTAATQLNLTLTQLVDYCESRSMRHLCAEHKLMINNESLDLVKNSMKSYLNI